MTSEKTLNNKRKIEEEEEEDITYSLKGKFTDNEINYLINELETIEVEEEYCNKKLELLYFRKKCINKRIKFLLNDSFKKNRIEYNNNNNNNSSFELFKTQN